MSVLSDARAELHTELLTVVIDPVNGLELGVGRVHQWPAQQPNAPCLWIEQPEGVMTQVGDQARHWATIVTFPVIVVHDGADRAQVAGLDELVARVWDAANRVPNAEPMRFRPQPINVGGPSLRGTRIDVEMTLRHTTFCPVPAPPPAREARIAEEVPVG